MLYIGAFGIRRVLTSIVLLALLYMSAEAVLAQDPSQDQYSTTGAKACLKCHGEAPVNTILLRPHGQSADKRTPFALHDCETCHGPSVEHREAPKKMENRPMPDVRFGFKAVTPAVEQNDVCLACHQSGLRINWKGSQHDFADVPCASCHTIHALRDRVQGITTQPSVCYACHADVRAQSQRFSHHPIRDGKMTCSNCHNPHGSYGPAQLKWATVNQTCFQCHADKRGPYLWEHVPVVEDCRNCHTPHGSTQPRLLKARAPWLCQNCHLADRHPSDVYDGGAVPPMGFNQFAVTGSCLNCHSQIHGSNHPSGVRFLR